MARYIDADELKIKYLKMRHQGMITDREYYNLIIPLAYAPTADVVERKKGKWIDCTEEGFVECPFCHSATNCDDNKEELHFCFSCGADMRGDDHEE